MNEPVALYVSNSSLNRSNIGGYVRRFGKGLRFECLRLGEAILRLQKEPIELDALVADIAGWGNSVKDFARLIGIANGKEYFFQKTKGRRTEKMIDTPIPVIYVVGEVVVKHFNQEDLEAIRCETYKDSAELYGKVKTRLGITDDAGQNSGQKGRFTDELRSIGRTMSGRHPRRRP